MKKFILKIFIAAAVPALLFLTVYFITDPLCILRPFAPDYYSNTVREYVSTEMFLRNNPKYHFNSFIFGSSRACFINSYVWKDLLQKNTEQNDSVSQFVFQGWIEDLAGIRQKMRFLERNSVPCNNALVLIDVPSSFDTVTTNRVKIAKHYLLSGMPKWKYQFYFAKNSVSKPSIIFSRIFTSEPKRHGNCDTITNDWKKDNRFHLECPPKRVYQDADKFLVKRPETEEVSEALITKPFEAILRDMKRFFDERHTNYRLFITPTYYRIKINPDDYKLLCEIFGSENLSDFSGSNKWADDMYNFDDALHFDHNVGWQILHEIYD